MLLEETRSYARAEADRKKKAIQEARYEQLRIAEDQVLRKPLGELPQLPEVDLSKIPNLPFPAKTGAGDE